ncbi:hypothetical protein C8J56DRAFT_152468 [Mycena floridula]|nr:hypothetical protein C8J56DRAFT_152468 [Mycena floridula]
MRQAPTREKRRTANRRMESFDILQRPTYGCTKRRPSFDRPVDRARSFFLAGFLNIVQLWMHLHLDEPFCFVPTLSKPILGFQCPRVDCCAKPQVGQKVEFFPVDLALSRASRDEMRLMSADMRKEEERILCRTRSTCTAACRDCHTYWIRLGIHSLPATTAPGTVR